MKCAKCGKSSITEVQYAGKNYCNTHFLELMEKRVRKNLRTRKLIDIKKEYVLPRVSSGESALTEFFLKRIFSDRLKFSKSKLEKNANSTSEKNPKSKFEKQPDSKEINMILPTNLDEQSLLFLDFFLCGNDEIFKEDFQSKIMPLEVLTEQEIMILCRILSIPHVKRTSNNVLDNLEDKYPGTKFSVFQSKMNILQKLKKK